MLRTNRQTDKQTDPNVLPTPTDRVDVGIITWFWLFLTYVYM